MVDAEEKDAYINTFFFSNSLTCHFINIDKRKSKTKHNEWLHLFLCCCNIFTYSVIYLFFFIFDFGSFNPPYAQSITHMLRA